MGSRSQSTIPTNFGISTEVADVISRAEFHVDRLRGFGLVGTEFRMFPQNSKVVDP
jgi:hypothetical protein